MNEVCLICKSDTSGWTHKQKESHGVQTVLVQWPVPGDEHQYEVHICRMCQIGLYSVYVDPFIEKHHQPLTKALDTVVQALRDTGLFKV